jgi:hypothetical protein
MASVYVSQFGGGRMLSLTDGRKLGLEQRINYSKDMRITDVVSWLDLNAGEHVDVYDVFEFAEIQQGGSGVPLLLNLEVSNLVTHNADTLRLWEGHGYPPNSVFLLVRIAD